MLTSAMKHSLFKLIDGMGNFSNRLAVKKRLIEEFKQEYELYTDQVHSYIEMLVDEYCGPAD